MMNRSLISTILMLLCFFLQALYGSAPLFLPKPQPASVSPDLFSAERAMAHVQGLAQAARVAGSPGMERAVNYLVERLRDCSLDPEIQKASSIKGMLRNVVVRIPGSHPGNALLIVTHVDSVSYGAGDNASGAAVLLEVACSLKSGNQLQNDIVLLFEDGEEEGYLGGYAFAKTDPSISTVRRAIGLDTAAWGPVVLLQTTPGNTDLIRAYAGSVPRPTAFGFFADADWYISQDSSEIQPFYERGIPALEFEDPTAFSWKHSDLDTVDLVKPGSLQQMGEQVLSLARALGDSDLTLSSTSDQSYFTLWGPGVAHYPANWNLVLAILAAIGWAALLVKGIRQRACTMRAIALSMLFLPLTLVGAAVVGIAGNGLFGRLFPNPNPNTGSYLIPASLPFFLTVILIVVSGYLFIWARLLKNLGSLAVSLAGLFFWLLIGFASAAMLRVGSYIFVFPLLTAVIAGFLPSKLKFSGIIPAGIATILLAPNVILAFLGTGMQTLVLVTFLAALNMELWVQAYWKLST